MVAILETAAWLRPRAMDQHVWVCDFVFDACANG